MDETHIAVRINEGKLLQQLRYAFSNRYTIVTELMQNARRAGASYVVIEYNKKTETLTARDDGCGIDDFQKLFTFGESGWDEGTIADENAFGLGFTKSLYAAKHCTVSSKGHEISFATADALAQKAILVTMASPGNETIVKLAGVKLPELDRRMETLVIGFPIRVIYNSLELMRPYALDCLDTIECSIGRVKLRGYAGSADGEHASTATLVFLQGFVVLDDALCASTKNIVHLDSTLFQARLPDRDALIDATEQYSRIAAALKEFWRRHLMQQKTALSEELFTQRYFDAAERWRLLDLFDDVPVLPGCLFNIISDYPYQHGQGNPDYLTQLEGVVTREAIETGPLKLVELDDPHEANIAHWMFARARNWVVFDDPRLSKSHWIHSFVEQLDQAACEVDIDGETARADLEGDWIEPTIVICAAYTIRLNDEAVRLTSDAMYWNNEMLVIVPPGDSSGRAAQQVSNFIDDNDQWLDGAQDHDTDALEDLIRLLRATDPVRALNSMLRELHLERYPSLRGKCFTLKVSEDADCHEIEWVA